MASKIIDIHPHIISLDTETYPISPLGGKQSVWSQVRPCDFSGLVKGMDEAGIDKAVIVHSSTTYGYNAAYVADSIEGHEDRFTAVFSVDFMASDAVAKLQYWIARGLAGTRLFAAGSTVKSDQGWIANPATFPAWEYCEAVGLPVAISMRQPAIPYLLELIERFPNVRIVIDHLMLTPIEDGYPYKQSQPFFDLAQFPQLFMKITTNNVRRSNDGKSTAVDYFGHLMGTFGSNRCAWGSNFPNEEGSLKQQLTEAHEAFASLSEAEQNNIFCNTALELYPTLRD